MANKIISLKSSRSSTTSKKTPYRSNEVYIDVDLKAKQFLPKKIYSGDYLETEETKKLNSENVLVENSTDNFLLNSFNTLPVEQQYRIARSVNVKAVFNSIQNLFSFTQGERLLFPEFGNKLRQYLYKGILDQNVEQITAEINRVCNTWEQRVNIVKIQNISSIEDTEDNIVRLNIIFTIPSIDDEQYEYSFTCNTIT